MEREYTKMVPLTDVKEGKQVTIAGIQCGKTLNKRLCDLGLYNGSKITVKRNDRGPVIIQVFDSSVAIGRGQAKKIMVE